MRQKLLFLALLTIICVAVVLSISQMFESNAQNLTNVSVSAEKNANKTPVVFSEFKNWISVYLSGNFGALSETEYLHKGERLAAVRREVLRTLMQSNPQAALENSISKETFERLPSSISRFLEAQKSFNGDFIVTAFDDFENEKNSRIEREAVTGDGTRYKAFVYGRRVSMTSKFDIPLRGIVIDDVMAVDESPARQLETGDVKKIAAEVGGKVRYFSNRTEFDRFTREQIEWEAKVEPVRRAENESSWTHGVKNVLFIRIDFPDRPGEPVDRNGFPLTEANAQNLILNQVSPFYVSNSYDKTSLQTVVTPVVRVPQPQGYYTRERLVELTNDARNAARAAGFETNNYNLDLVAFGYTPILTFSGIAAIGTKSALLNGTFTFKVATHELGHNYGLMHANLWRTFDGTIIGANGNNVEYGDEFDMMGRGASQISHFNASYKRTLEWLTEYHVKTVTNTGVYRLYAYDLDSPQGTRVLKIKKDFNKDYWVEFRQLFVGDPNLMNGAMIRWDFPADNWRQTQFLDMSPNTPSLYDGTLLIGQTFADAESGIKITVLGKGNTTPESLDIKVEFNYAILKGAPFDFDGDNKSDIGVFRPADGAWYLNKSTEGFAAINWGAASDKIVPAKFNGDRTTDIAVFRDGVWYMQNPFGGNPIVVRFGQAGDIPVPSDYDGDGFAEMAVYRPADGTWYVWNWVYSRFSAFRFGIQTDKPVPADYDGDGKTDIAVYRPENGYWYLLRSQAGFTATQFGIAEDKPVAGDYDNDGKADLAVYRPSSGVWYQLRSTEGFTGTQFGISTDSPAPADYDGDGRIDLAVFRSGVWYLLQTTRGFTSAQFGQAGDKSIANSYVY